MAILQTVRGQPANLARIPVSGLNRTVVGTDRKFEI